MCGSGCDLLLARLTSDSQGGERPEFAIAGAKDAGAVVGFCGLQSCRASALRDLADPGNHRCVVQALCTLGLFLKLGPEMPALEVMPDAVASRCPMLPGNARNWHPLSECGL